VRARVFHLGTLSLGAKRSGTKDFSAFSLEKSKCRRFRNGPALEYPGPRCKILGVSQFIQKGNRVMFANYHTHTTRCNHAVGTEKEYVEAAIQNGLKVLGFSDHAPYPYPDPTPYYTKHTMKLQELDDYCDTILALRREYQNDIDIYLGLETEYYPAYFDRHMDNLANYPIDYLILGQHFLGNGEDGPGSIARTTDPSRLIQYCDLVIEGLATGRFTYIAHPDLIGFMGDPNIYDTQMRRLCKCAKALNLPAEINFHGYFGSTHYPNDAFWRIAGEEGCPVVYALDAHTPVEFQFQERLTKARNLVSRYNLQVLDVVPLRNPL